jgi:hypothetical protein
MPVDKVDPNTRNKWLNDSVAKCYSQLGIFFNEYESTFLEERTQNCFLRKPKRIDCCGKLSVGPQNPIKPRLIQNKNHVRLKSYEA